MTPEELRVLQEQDSADFGTFQATSMEYVEMYYVAEENAQEEFPDVASLSEPSAVVPFMVAALEAAEYSTDPEPVVIFDVPDESDRSGYVRDGVIHLHPKILNPWVILHELAHSIDPRQGHSARWAFIYVELVTAVIGVDAGAALRREFEALDLPCHW